MGAAAWASTGRPEVLDRLYSEIFNLWLDVFGELKEALADETPEESRFVILQKKIFLTLLMVIYKTDLP